MKSYVDQFGFQRYEYEPGTATLAEKQKFLFDLKQITYVITIWNMGRDGSTVKEVVDKYTISENAKG